MSELWRLGACELAAGIRARTCTSEEVLHSVLERIDALNPHLNAIIQDYREEALDLARNADAAVARGDALGDLHGVPVTIKDNIDVAGKPTPNGVAAFAGVIGPADSPLVSNLRRAGAIVIGRTNTPEFSMRGTTDNPMYGRTRNPWHDEASPGGSSGGAGAAAAAGFGPVHHGNDIGGSLRFPSFACGVATIKPSFGRVPAYNPSQTAERGMLAQLMAVQGVICREVRDVALATRAAAAYDPRDPWWVPVPFDGEALPAPIKVAFTREAYGYPIHPELVAALDRVAGYLDDAGYDVVEVETPSIADAAAGWHDVAGFELAATMGPMVAEHGSADIRQIFEFYETGSRLADDRDYRLALAERTAQTRRWNEFMDRWPLVLSPYLMCATFPWNYDVQGREQAQDLFQAAMYSTGTNFLSLPCGVVPVGLVDALPAGVQLIGRRYREDLILQAMQVVEDRVGVLSHQLWSR